MTDEFNNNGSRIYEVAVTRIVNSELHTTVRIAADSPDEAESVALSIVADFGDDDFDYCPDYPDSNDSVDTVEAVEPTDDEMDEEDRENALADSYCGIVNQEAEAARRTRSLSESFGAR